MLREMVAASCPESGYLVSRITVHCPKESTMNAVQFRESWKQFKVPLKAEWTKLTDEDLLKIDGDQEKFHSAVQAHYSSTKEEVIKWVERRYAKWSGWYEGYEEAKVASKP
jgi:uncharacterized protein YjbJ (UPF0337 family)